MTKNLRVLPTFLVEGVVSGTWSIERKKRIAALTVSPFAPLPLPATQNLIAEGDRLLRFAEQDADTYDVHVSAQ